MSKPNQIKQVIVMRHDLGMRRGKQIAQGAHASMAFLTRRIGKALEKGLQRVWFGKTSLEQFVPLSDVEKEWLESSFAKVCCRVDSEIELREIFARAEAADLEVVMITDSGKTEFHGKPTPTCVAIGPDYAEKIDPITGHLKLL
jgi:PTH2 family peptidyl-tRNA hydrolase